MLGGLFVALGAAEAGLRLLVTPDVPPLPDIRGDSFTLPAVTTRQIEEGIAVARFSRAGARLTGNEPISPGPRIVLIGDSHVVAREVPDSATIGARLERTARAEGVPLTIRQYGWRGASPARYVAEAPAVLERWNPTAVVIPLANDDLDDHVVGGTLPHFRINDQAEVTLVRGTDSPPGPAPRSVLAMAVMHRWLQLVDRAPRVIRRLMTPPAPPELSAQDADRPLTRAQADTIPFVVVRELKKAYGARLALVFLADVRVTGGDTASDLETKLLSACHVQAVRCVSTWHDMRIARMRGIIARGFTTTTIGVGHLNPAGDSLAAEDIWRLIRSDKRLAGR